MHKLKNLSQILAFMISSRHNCVYTLSSKHASRRIRERALPQLFYKNCLAPRYLPKVIFLHGIYSFVLFLIKPLHESIWEVLDHFNRKDTVCTLRTLDYQKFHFLVQTECLHMGGSNVIMTKLSSVAIFKYEHFLTIYWIFFYILHFLSAIIINKKQS